MDDVIVIWDDPDDEGGNTHHIREHGIDEDEVESVLCNPDNQWTVSRSSGRPVTFGWTNTGRHIVVVWEDCGGDPRAIYPVTAYETPEPRRRRG